MFSDEQRLAFGSVADLYDEARPSYPAEAVDAVIDAARLTPPMRIFEVGAGTGKATVLFADRGLGVMAIEPSPEMARVARANCARYEAVEIVESDLESWEPPERRAALLSAQAWHWINPKVRYPRAHRALVPGGTLAAIWTFPDWDRCSLRNALSDAYRASAPQMTADFPMHPGSRPADLAGDWQAEIDAGRWFTEPRVRIFPWQLMYTSAEYTRLLETHQDHILMPASDRIALLGAIAGAIEASGGGLSLPFATHVCLASRV